MTVLELCRRATADPERLQLYVNGFIDDFRRANATDREAMTTEGPGCCGPIEGLIAAVTATLCREAGMIAPDWVGRVASPEPFFPFPARGFALRFRLMLESPAAFRIRNVFVPENYLSRA